MSAARLDWAKWEPITGRSTRSNKAVRFVVHITAVRANDIYGPNKGPGGSYAHCHNSRNGDFRQHQELTKMAYAETTSGSAGNISCENEGVEGDSLTDAQIENLARLFAHCVTELGVPNRIATVDNTHGLAWHRLGVSGNFGAYNKNDRTTWSRAQTGLYFSSARGKTCPTNNVIRQIPDIYNRAQRYINGTNTEGSLVATKEEIEAIAYAVWSYKNEKADNRDAFGIMRGIPKDVWLYKNEKVTNKDAYGHLIGASAIGVQQIKSIVEAAVNGIPGVDAKALANTVADRVVETVVDISAEDVAERLTVTPK